MLKSHFDAVEDYLLALKKIGDNTGHSLHKGTPREVFIQEFLKNHLSEKVSIGSGEIIDMNSLSGEKRNQHDIVIFKNEYPRIDFGGNIRGFLAESVIATIEIKSNLTENRLKKAINAAKTVKNLETSRGATMRMGWTPPAPLNFVVAYGGPAKMETVHGWIEKIYEEEGIQYPAMPPTKAERFKIPSPAIDAIFILGKGFLQFDNFPAGFIQDSMRTSDPESKWGIADMDKGSLLMLFIFLTQAITGFSFTSFNPASYVSRVNIQAEDFRFK
jgi:hypothetical protein